MSVAYPMQKIQDWLTQQWVIIGGRKINPSENKWLLGPFGELNGIGEHFIKQLAEKESLIIDRNNNAKGLLSSINNLQLTEKEFNKLSKNIIDFYECTSMYKLRFSISWNPFFKIFGILINWLFSTRIKQLNLPTRNSIDSENITSEIIQLINPESGEIKYTIWLRKYASNSQVIYSGIYETCILPSGITCIKAIFPLPKGNATVLMKPSVENDGGLILDSSGKKFGDAGFYFLLNDSKGNFWSKYLSSFTDKLVLYKSNDLLIAKQTLKLWKLKTVVFNYKIHK